jgi:hypothetical protein
METNVRHICYFLNDAYSKYYATSEHLAMDEREDSFQTLNTQGTDTLQNKNI